jgi:hypothetical protein
VTEGRRGAWRALFARLLALRRHPLHAAEVKDKTAA